MSEDRPNCPQCGAGTTILNEQVEETVSQVHQCLDVQCSYIFVLVEDVD